MKIKVLYKTPLATGYVGEETMSESDFEERKKNHSFEFNLTSDIGIDYDRGKFDIRNAIEDIKHNTDETKTFIVRDFKVRKRSDQTWVSYTDNQFKV